MSGYIPNPPQHDNMRGCGTMIVFFLGFLVGAFSIGVPAYDIVQHSFQKVAIERGCAQFNPQTGKFEWLSK